MHLFSKLQRWLIIPLLLVFLALPIRLLAAPYGQGVYSGGQYNAGSSPPPPPPPPPCGKSGDINNDCIVNIFDLSILLSRYNSSDAAADLNHNGSVDIFDLSILLTNYGK